MMTKLFCSRQLNLMKVITEENESRVNENCNYDKKIWKMVKFNLILLHPKSYMEIYVKTLIIVNLDSLSSAKV